MINVLRLRVNIYLLILIGCKAHRRKENRRKVTSPKLTPKRTLSKRKIAEMNIIEIKIIDMRIIEIKIAEDTLRGCMNNHLYDNLFFFVSELYAAETVQL